MIASSSLYFFCSFLASPFLLIYSISIFTDFSCQLQALNTSDPGHQLEWFTSVLTQARIVKQKVLVISHIPPGTPSIPSSYFIYSALLSFLTSLHLTSPHRISSHLISSHVTSSHRTSPHLTSLHFTSPLLMKKCRDGVEGRHTQLSARIFRSFLYDYF